jgi:hypothetical protein
LIHHLAIGKGISFNRIADFFYQTTKYLIIEFVPLQDEKVQLILNQKTVSFNSYDQHGFESAFSPYFTIEKKETIPGSYRTL